jgi:formate/nitrite transporter FocA (FNT family)
MGKSYYFIIHAYHHVIARMVEITGKREGDVEDVRWVYSSTKTWTQFFQEGAGTTEETICRYFTPGSITWIAAFDWPHPIPEAS